MKMRFVLTDESTPPVRELTAGLSRGRQANGSGYLALRLGDWEALRIDRDNGMLRINSSDGKGKRWLTKCLGYWNPDTGCFEDEEPKATTPEAP